MFGMDDLRNLVAGTNVPAKGATVQDVFDALSEANDPYRVAGFVCEAASEAEFSDVDEDALILALRRMEEEEVSLRATVWAKRLAAKPNLREAVQRHVDRAIMETGFEHQLQMRASRGLAEAERVDASFLEEGVASVFAPTAFVRQTTSVCRESVELWWESVREAKKNDQLFESARPNFDKIVAGWSARIASKTPFRVSSRKLVEMSSDMSEKAARFARKF